MINNRIVAGPALLAQAIERTEYELHNPASRRYYIIGRGDVYEPHAAISRRLAVLKRIREIQC